MGLSVRQDGVRRNGLDLLRYPGVDIERLAAIWPELAELPGTLGALIETEAKYRGYQERQEADVAAYRRDEALRLPAALEYAEIGGLSTEAREALDAARPATLGAAARLPGITPAALIALLRYVKRGGRRAA